MEKLTEQLDEFINRLADSDNFRQELSDLCSIYPFSKYEYIISTLLANGKFSFDEYLTIRDDYIDRNLFLYVFEITAPRGFGDTWALGHLHELEPGLQRPNKRIDAGYKGEYDLFFEWKANNIKIEVKASRANDREKHDEPLYLKALSSDSNRPFLMNFQQLKPSCCDVFLWIAVYRDAIKYWVMNSDTIQKHPDFTPQHRNEETASRRNDYRKEDIYEGQIMMTEKNIRNFDKYLVSGKDLKEAIIEQYKRLK
ncbi:hypothetical protein FACS1894170_02400 [Planctomycetales bacterium]|nr:hypothetical protein FACS1894170_02400 [Planctomycetales bacterium]